MRGPSAGPGAIRALLERALREIYGSRRARRRALMRDLAHRMALPRRETHAGHRDGE